jgi:hypothetical protein
MGTFRCGLLLAASLFAGASFGQNAVTNPATGVPPAEQPAPTLPATVAPEADTNAPAGIGNPISPVMPDANVSTNKHTKPKAAAPALPTTRGTLSSVDSTNMTVTIEAKGKDEVFKVTSKTRIFNEAKPAIFSDAKAGQKAVIEYRNGKDKSKEALTLRLGAAGAPTATEHKAPTKNSKPTIKKKKAGTAKKKATPAEVPAPAPVDTTAPAPAPAGVTPPNP